MILFHPPLCGIISGTKHAFNLSVELLDPVAQTEQATNGGRKCMRFCNLSDFVCRKPSSPTYIEPQIKTIPPSLPFVLVVFLALS